MLTKVTIKKNFIRLMLGLSVFGLTTLFMSKENLVNVAPDPIFKPILSDIQRKLPKGWLVRLPSKVYLTDYEGKQVRVYPHSNSKFRM